MRCKVCKFYQPPPPKMDGDDNLCGEQKAERAKGECWLKPPVAIQDFISVNARSLAKSNWGSPKVSPDHFCGEFKMDLE